MKILIRLFLLILVAQDLPAQEFRRIITSYAIRLPEAYPPSLPPPQFENMAGIKADERLGYDNLIKDYQKKISQLETQEYSVQRDTMILGYLHDQIVVQSFIDYYDMGKLFEQGQQPTPGLTLLPLAQKLRKLAIEANHSYYTWAGFIWEEVTWYNYRDIVKSFEVAFQRAQLCDSCPDCKQAPECYVALAQYYAEFNDTINTDLYFEKALNSTSEIPEKVFTLREWAVVYNKQHKPSKALKVIERLYEIDKNPFDESWILGQKAIAYTQLGQFDQALITINEAMSQEKDEMIKMGYLKSKTEAYLPDNYRSVLAKIYLGKKDPQKAWDYANSAGFWDELEGSPDRTLYEIHKALGNDKKALHHYEQYTLFKEDQESNNKKNVLAIMQRNYEVQKVQNVADAEKLRAENLLRTRTFLFIGLALLAAFLFLLWRINRQKQFANVELKRQKQEVDFQRNKAEQALIDLQATQRELVQKEKMASLGELTAGIAHEIQNPLNFVNNFSESGNELIPEMNDALNKGDILEAKSIAADIQQNLERINHHGKRADAIVKGMLQHSRTSTGVKEPSDINAIADEYLRLAYHGLRAKDKDFFAKLETAFDPAAGKINIIPQDIGRVLLNLFNNAFYAVAEKVKSHLKAGAAEAYEPIIAVTTRKIGDQLEITVRDNGNGIPEKIRDKIFQPFFTTKPTGQGTGLGLSLSYDIVTKGHGGELKVKSMEGEGTEFCILLPL